MNDSKPVHDWSIDFDHLDPQWTSNPYAIWDALRPTCPVATSQRFEDGAYLPLSYNDIYAIAYDTEHFSSRRIIVREQKVPIVGVPPITSDPPEHTPARRILLPPFAPREVQKLEPLTRDVCVSLLEAVGDRNEFDAAVEYAQSVPVHIMCQIMGLDVADAETFRDWIYRTNVEGVRNTQANIIVRHEMNEYFLEQINQRRAHPGADLISYLLTVEIEGQPLTERHILGTLVLLIIAGIDTTWSSIGASIWHLATHPDDLRRLVAEPELLPTAVEEFLRAYAPVTMAREVVKETTLSGCPFKEGGQVLLSYPAANRDPAKFPDAEKVLIDRAHNPHAAFGLGRHRCLGSNLARMEMIVALEEWLKRYPSFQLQEGAVVTWSEGTVRGPRTVPVKVYRQQTC
ncbi:MAG: cytochrome P450 [Candidatus Kapabacteria bacterium]|nr:cytochrome P450 [Candidatus Kapabacteria bacterium]